MKKFALYYCAIIYMFSFLLTLIATFQNRRSDYVIICVLSLAAVMAVYFIISDKYKTLSFIYLAIISVLQAFHFLAGGVSYKFGLGPAAILEVDTIQDTMVRFKMPFLEMKLEILYLAGNNDFVVGVNFIKLALFLYFISLVRMPHSKNVKTA